MNTFAGRVAVVTGAAGELGGAFARQAAALGMRLVLADRDAGALEWLAGTLQAGGAEVLAMVCDVGVCAHVEELADAAMIRFHGVHLLFNDGNDGSGAHAAIAGAAWEASEAAWKRALDARLWGALHGVRIFTPLMLDCARRGDARRGDARRGDARRGDARHGDARGHIVNVAPASVPAGAPGYGIDNVCGHALLALSETLYHDLRRADAPVGVSVLCAPPAPASSGLAGAHENTGGAAPPSAAELAGLAFDAVRSRAFWVVPPPRALDMLEGRLHALAAGAAP